MIVSHKHKFIFIKPPKVAGTSVELILSRIVAEGDIITPFGYSPDESLREKWGAKKPQNFSRKLAPWHWSPWLLKNRILLGKGNRFEHWSFSEHLKPDVIKRKLKNGKFNDYLKISIIRNPWDQAVSQFHWELYQETFFGGFEEFIHTRYRSIWPYYIDEFQNFCVDYVIRFEFLETDVTSLLCKLNMSSVNVDFPKAKTTVRSSRKPYQEYFYNRDLVDQVRYKNFFLIDRFGYDFE